MPDLAFDDATHGDQRGGITRVIDVNPTVSTSAYASGDAVGGLLTLAGAARHPNGSGVVHSIAVCSDTALTVDLDIAIFDQNPSGSTTTDNGAASIVAADAPKCVGVVSLVNSDSKVDLGASDIVTKTALNLPFNIPVDSRDLYAVVIIRGVHTPAATDALTFRFGILQD